MEQCIICLETDGEIFDYEHTCGTYKVHRHCITNWLTKNNCECLICREKIITEEEEMEFRQEYNLTVRPAPIVPPRQNPVYPVITHPQRNFRIINNIENNFNCICSCMITIIFISLFMVILNGRT